ncbi:hypothetical protein [Actinomadura keratinilytica]|uniref:hypothetical protein n=1 Tax=Actinomadura keratinilytica TaxID=547461 RepID=UPI00361C1287
MTPNSRQCSSRHTSRSQGWPRRISSASCSADQSVSTSGSTTYRTPQRSSHSR